YVDPEFVSRAKTAGCSVIVAGELYGQGSSREVAAIGPMHLGVRAVLAKSFARIHRANLINWGVVPLTFDDPAAHDGIERDDPLRLPGLRSALAAAARVSGGTGGTGGPLPAACALGARERAVLPAVGLPARTPRGTAGVT